MRLTAATAARHSAKAAEQVEREAKVYRLKNGIPADIRNPSAGRAILESISRHRGATINTIRKDMKRGFSDATLRFYLGRFQTRKVVVAK